MISIDESYVDAAAPNASAIKNGRGLVLKGKFVKLLKSDDETLIFGECKGSGKSSYKVSADFVRPDQPTFRCSCPSRQFPCKHSLGLMYAWAQGKTFKVGAVPEDLAGKREKLQVRVAKRKERAAKPKTVNKAALQKKIKAQLKGLDLLETLTHDLVRMGMGNTTAKTAQQIGNQAKQLGNAFLPGARAALLDYTQLFSGDDGRFDGNLSANQRESIYTDALDQLTRLHTLIKRGRGYLEKRLVDPELKPDTDTTIAAWLGHAWQLAELREAGQVQHDVELVQLAFNTHDDSARREYIDTGIWMNLKDGEIRLTQTFRPYQAAQFIKSEDSFFQVACVKELCIYPGEVNPRVRWDEMAPRPMEKKDYAAIRKAAHADFAALVKRVKGHLKAPLGQKRPVFALSFAQLGRAGDDYVVEDKTGARLGLTDTGIAEDPASLHLLGLLPKKLHKNQTLVGRFHNDLDTGQLRVKPLSIVTTDAIVRLTF